MIEYNIELLERILITIDPENSWNITHEASRIINTYLTHVFQNFFCPFLSREYYDTNSTFPVTITKYWCSQRLQVIVQDTKLVNIVLSECLKSITSYSGYSICNLEYVALSLDYEHRSGLILPVQIVRGALLYPYSPPVATWTTSFLEHLVAEIIEISIRTRPKRNCDQLYIRGLHVLESIRSDIGLRQIIANDKKYQRVLGRGIWLSANKRVMFDDNDKRPLVQVSKFFSWNPGLCFWTGTKILQYISDPIFSNVDLFLKSNI